MSYFGLSNINAVNTLFSGLGGNGSKTGSVSTGSNVLADYASIRSGSYHKLLKSYYNKDKEAVTDAVKNSVTSTSVAKDSTKELTRMEKAGENLKKSVDELITQGTKSVFKQESVKNSDGTFTKKYDTDAIYKKVNAFVENYNTAIEETEDANTMRIARTSEQMTTLTNAYKNQLNKIGITVKSDNTLSIDKDTFEEADMDTVKNLFNGTCSYAYSVGVKASMIDYYAQNEASKSNTYAETGYYNFNYNYGSNYSNYI